MHVTCQCQVCPSSSERIFAPMARNSCRSVGFSMKSVGPKCTMTLSLSVRNDELQTRIGTSANGGCSRIAFKTRSPRTLGKLRSSTMQSGRLATAAGPQRWSIASAPSASDTISQSSPSRRRASLTRNRSASLSSTIRSRDRRWSKAAALKDRHEITVSIVGGLSCPPHQRLLSHLSSRGRRKLRSAVE